MFAKMICVLGKLGNPVCCMFDEVTAIVVVFSRA